MEDSGPQVTVNSLKTCHKALQRVPPQNFQTIKLLAYFHLTYISLITPQNYLQKTLIAPKTPHSLLLPTKLLNGVIKKSCATTFKQKLVKYLSKLTSFSPFINEN